MSRGTLRTSKVLAQALNLTAEETGDPERGLGLSKSTVNDKTYLQSSLRISGSTLPQTMLHQDSQKKKIMERVPGTTPVLPNLFCSSAPTRNPHARADCFPASLAAGCGHVTGCSQWDGRGRHWRHFPGGPYKSSRLFLPAD